MTNAAVSIGPREYAVIAILQRIVMETMDFPPSPSYDSESYLPAHLIEQAQQALGEYGVRVQPNPAMMAERGAL